jgi:hypothetical protein
VGGNEEAVKEEVEEERYDQEYEFKIKAWSQSHFFNNFTDSL